MKVKNDHLRMWKWRMIIYNRSSKMNYFMYTSHHFTPHGRYELNKLTSLPVCGFIAQLVEQRTGNAEVTLFCTTTMPFCMTYTWHFLVTHYFLWRNCRMWSPKILLLVFLLVLFFFFTVAYFHLVGRSLLAVSISRFLTATMNFYVFLPTKFISSVFNHSF